MVQDDIPYFMTNEEWYTVTGMMSDDIPEDGRGYHLTDKAPQEAMDSYNDFYAELEEDE